MWLLNMTRCIPVCRFNFIQVIFDHVIVSIIVAELFINVSVLFGSGCAVCRGVIDDFQVIIVYALEVVLRVKTWVVYFNLAAVDGAQVFGSV
jgi:hypothetical protein